MLRLIGRRNGIFSPFKIGRIKALFSKLVSLTTDGASNTIGSERGLFACFCHLLKTPDTLEKDRIDGIQNIWCFAHRMNLATWDLREVPNMNDVFTVSEG